MGLNSFSTTDPIPSSGLDELDRQELAERPRQSKLQKLETADIVFYLYNNGIMEIVKNRYYGQTGWIEGHERIKVLVELIANLAFNNTCVMFQEALKRKIYNILEGEGYDKI